MIYLAICWTVLLAVFSSTGVLFMGLLGLGGYDAGDRFIISSWLGMAMVCSMLLFVSNFSALSSGTGLFAVLMPFALLAVRDIRVNFKRETFARLGMLDGKKLLSYAFVLLPTAIAGAEIVKWYDTGLYHWGLVKWLSEYGSVEGLGLVHVRFGLVSSWFTLPAILNFPPFAARVASVPGGMVLLLLLLHFIVCASRLVSRNADAERRGDLFVCAYTIMLFPYLSVIRMFVSPSPDMPLIVISCFIAWLMLTAKIDEEKVNKTAVNNRLMPLVISAWAVTIKLSALPLLAVSVLFYIFGRGRTARKLLVSGLLIAVLLLPFMLVNIRVSGCLLFPEPLTCVEGPSSLGTDAARRLSGIISSWARWTGPMPEDASVSNWLRTWVQNENILAVLLIASVFSFILILLNRPIRKSAVNWPLALGMAGICFVMLKAPALRLGLGYPALVVALLPVVYYDFAAKLVPWAGRAKSTTPFLMASMLVMTGIILSGIVHDRFSHFVRGFEYSVNEGLISAAPPLSSTLFLPPRILNFCADIRHKGTADELHIIKPLQIERKWVGDINYYVPVDTDQCWDMDIPCTPHLGFRNIKLKDPHRGLAGGFIRGQ